MMNTPSGDNMCSTDFVLNLSLQNKGDLPDNILSINMPGSSLVTVSGENSTTIPANIDRFTTYYCIEGMYESGDEVSFTIRMESRLILPVAVRVE